MGAIATTYSFTATDTITSAKMNNIIAQSKMTSDAIFNGTLDLASDKLLVKASGITSNELAGNSVVTAKISDLNVTTGKIADLGVTTAKIADLNVTTGKIANASVTAAKLSGAQSGTAPVYGVRAWVRFNGNKNDAGILDSSNTPRQILGSGNITSVTKNATGDYNVSIAANMPSANYVAVGQRGYEAGNTSNVTIQASPLTPQTVSTFRLLALNSAGTAADASDVQILFIG